jgi:hypothetical protein
MRHRSRSKSKSNDPGGLVKEPFREKCSRSPYLEPPLGLGGRPVKPDEPGYLPFTASTEMEVTGGFEPPNRGFADLRLRPLGYVTTGWSYGVRHRIFDSCWRFAKGLARAVCIRGPSLWNFGQQRQRNQHP